MSDIGKPERTTQNRVIALFRDELGYRYLGDRADREDNSNIEEELLRAYLTRNGYSPAQISSTVYKLRTEADNHSRSLYGNNQAVYSLLRYGVPVKIEAGKVTETVHLINWQEPEKNDFAIAREVTLRGSRERRPDIVLYVNGIAIGIIELKNSRISIGEGIRQSLSNQRPEFNEWFFSTVQFVFAGNDSEGLQYGTVGTPEKYFLKWKEDEEDDSRFKLDKYLLKICCPERLIELMHDLRAGEPKHRGLAMSYARRLGDAINPATLLLGRGESQPELFLQGSREDAAKRMTLPAGHARHLVDRCTLGLTQHGNHHVLLGRGASGRVAAPGSATIRLPTTADRSARRGRQPSFAFRHRAERSTAPATAWR
jgi:hypothetical protein